MRFRFQILILSGLLLLIFSCRTSLSTYLEAPEQGLPRKVSYGEENLPMVSAHRGGRYYKGYPENSIELFAFTSSQVEAIIECDVNMSKDSVLLLMHDRSLDRTTTGEGKVREKNWKEIRKLKLVDDFGNLTDYRVPSLKETLKWAEDKVWLTLDVKRGVPYKMVIDLVQQMKAQSYAAIITYSFDAAKEVYGLDSTLLISVGIRDEESLGRYKQSEIPMDNLIAFTGTREPDPSIYKALHEEGVICMLGTLGNLDKQVQTKGEHLYKNFRKRGADILATDRPLEAFKALSE